MPFMEVAASAERDAIWRLDLALQLLQSARKTIGSNAPDFGTVAEASATLARVSGLMKVAGEFRLQAHERGEE